MRCVQQGAVNQIAVLLVAPEVVLAVLIASAGTGRKGRCGDERAMGMGKREGEGVDFRGIGGTYRKQTLYSIVSEAQVLPYRDSPYPDTLTP